MSDTIRANVEAFLTANGFTFAAQYVAQTQRDGWDCDEWRVTFKLVGTYEKPAPKGVADLVTSFYTGPGHRKQVQPMPSPAYRKGTLAYAQWAKSAFKPKAPHAADVLHSLVLDSSAINESFVDWCGNLGYDTDSIKARNTYDACCTIGQQMRALFGSEHMQSLSEMLQDY